MTDTEKHVEPIRNMIHGEVRVHESMREHTTFRIGGPVDIFVLPGNIEDVKHTIDYAKDSEIPYRVVGNGSNLLVSDSGIRGIVIKMGKNMGDVEFDGEMVRAQAGILLPNLARLAAEHELSGLEYAVGIPGSLGGAVVMNAGSGGQDTSQVLTSVRVLNTKGEIANIGKDDSDFGYRDSRFKHSGEIVLAVELQLQHEESTVISKRMKSLMEQRRKTMPLKYPSVGSVFKNPKDDFAGRLIEQAGCKGLRKGGAQVSDLHANWILNLGQARASDVLELISYVQNTVLKEFGIQLELELSMIS